MIMTLLIFHYMQSRRLRMFKHGNDSMFKSMPNECILFARTWACDRLRSGDRSILP